MSTKEHIKEYNKKYRQTEAYKESKRKFKEKNPDYYRKASLAYYHKDPDAVNARRRKNPYSLMSILKRNAKKREIEFNLTREYFAEWWNTQEQKCVYCEIPVERMAVVNKSKKLAKRLSIDRVDNEKGYIEGNLALCCMSCNFIKSNLLSFEEMKEIGIKYIKPKWQL